MRFLSYAYRFLSNFIFLALVYYKFLIFLNTMIFQLFREFS